MPMFKILVSAAAIGAAVFLVAPARADIFSFKMLRSAGAAATPCLPHGKAIVTITSGNASDNLNIRATGLPARATFDLFVTQVPNAPFGISWYLGQLQTNNRGTALGDFVGRFTRESFVVAPGTAVAPVVFPGDASSNPATPPVHTYHLGLWFHAPADAVAAGCSGAVTPFNGHHNAGVQALSTRNFADDHGPLRRLK